MSWDRLSKHKSIGGLGFRHFRDFNIAMLGKQGWRFISNPESLVTKVYKARYWADSDFLNSSLGSNPSFVWRSIFEAKSLVAEGCRWRLGSGESINITGQPWLQENCNPYVSTVSPVLRDKKVASLLCMDSKEWDIEVVRDVFNERDQECILKIPLSADSSEDVMFWNLEDSGNYSVKSAYRLLQTQRGGVEMRK